MLIAKPRITHDDGEVCISASVRVDAPGYDGPEEVWFRFPERCRDVINERSDAFVAALIPAAMLLGEDLVVEGSVSPRLAQGIRSYQVAYAQWYPRRYHVVDVEYGGTSAGVPFPLGNAVGSTCSGGIDSLYSLLQHMPGRESVPGGSLTHCLLVNGFNWDVDLELEREFRQVVATYEPLLARYGVDLIVARHNAQMVLEAVERLGRKPATWETAVIGPVLMLGRLFRMFYLPGGATFRADDMQPHGWHPAGLPLLSTEETQLVFDGGDATRAQKTEAIAQWEETYPILRVCWRATVFNPETGLVENCCECPKCIRTMVTLEAVGALTKYKTFPKPLTREKIRATHHVSRDEKMFYFDMVEMARKHGRTDIVRDLRYARLRSRLIAAVRHRLLRRKRKR